MPNGTVVKRGLAPDAQKPGDTHVFPGMVTAGDNGAVVVVVVPIGGEFQGPFVTMSQISSNSAMPVSDNISSEVASMSFPFIRVDQLPWAQTGRTKGCKMQILLFAMLRY